MIPTAPPSWLGIWIKHSHLLVPVQFWCVNCDGQMPTQLLAHSPLLKKDRRRKWDGKKFFGLKAERLLTSYCHGKSILDLGKINFIYCLFKYVSIMIQNMNRQKSQNLLLIPLFPGSFLACSSTTLHWRICIVACGEFIIAPIHHFFLFLLLHCSSMGSAPLPLPALWLLCPR